MKNSHVLAMMVMVAVGVAVTGCSSSSLTRTSPRNQLQRVETILGVSQDGKKPNVFVKARFLHGEPPPKGAIEAQHGAVCAALNYGMNISADRARLRNQIVSEFKKSGLFGNVSANEADQSGADLTFAVDVYNYVGTGWSTLGAFMTGLTLYLLPSSGTDNYIVHVKLLDKSEEIIGEVKNKDAIRSWCGVWFMSMSATQKAQEAYDQTVNNQLRAALKDLAESGKLK